MQNRADLERAAAELREAVVTAGNNLVERGALVDTILLAAVAREHLLVIGPPGTAKSEAARRVARAVGGRYFEYLLGRFTEPSEIFGPVDLRRLREGVVETRTDGMLPEAEIAFLDEIFLGSTAILNALLGILNERTFRRGHTIMAVPLRLCVGASNTLPTDPTLAAFADRFLLRVFLDAIPEPHLEDLLEGGWNLAAAPVGIAPPASLATLDLVADAVPTVDLTAIRPTIARALRLLRRAGLALSDRRAVKTQKLIAAAAVLAGRLEATEADLWPIIAAVPTEEEQSVARDALRDMLAGSANDVLGAAAEEASMGPAARAMRIAALGEGMLAERPPSENAEALRGWGLKLEGVLREIDAGFAPERMPERLATLRAELAAAATAVPATDVPATESAPT